MQVGGATQKSLGAGLPIVLGGVFQNHILLFVNFSAIQINAVHVVHESRQCSVPNCKGVLHLTEVMMSSVMMSTTHHYHFF